MSVGAEREWWKEAKLSDLHGEPAYDIDGVADRVMGAIDQVPGFAIGADMTMLDLGCGTGRLAMLMARRIVGPYTFVWGVDIHLRYDVGAGNRHGFALGDGRNIPREVGALNAAWSITMFQHIPYDAMWGYLHQVHERLKPGGVFVFTIAEGDTDEFLNHQIPNPTQFGWDLADLFDRVSVSPADERGWTWVEAWKDSE